MHRAEFTAEFPPIALYDQHNQAVELGSLFDRRNNVVFAFFFTHCISVCSTITESLKSLQPELPAGTLIAMISIDPDTDTPELLGAYVKRHQINDQDWYLLTGDNHKIIQFQKSFEAYRGNKMNHSASLFVKRSNSDRVTEFTRDFADIAAFLKPRQSAS
jgi:cytochrome oxidase Cu insertion factor (SCO1/SenC/PrrC family)